MKLTWKVIIGTTGGFLLGNALWDALKIGDPVLSIIIGGALVLIAVKA